ESNSNRTGENSMTIKEARMEAGLSRAEMSRQFKIPIRTLENWDNGVNHPPEWAEILIVEKLNWIKEHKETGKQ
ncbi:MAG: hypothetical protein SOV77_12745, partial [Lachnospiraceae bacterium]|nr:hypothetical protein [Lachnospiraceae bacterium]